MNESRKITSHDLSRYVVNPTATARRGATGPATPISGKRVVRSGIVVPPTTTSRLDVYPAAVAVSWPKSASGASMSGDSGSKGPHAPPVERDRTDSHRPAVP